VLTEREEKASVAIASNDSFGGWTKTFTDPRLCAAIVDRLTFGGNIIETGTDSYRLARPALEPTSTTRADQHGRTRASSPSAWSSGAHGHLGHPARAAPVKYLTGRPPAAGAARPGKAQ